MLDINKVAKQLPGIGQHLVRENTANQHRLQLATASLRQAISRQPELAAIHQQWGNRLFFNTSIPVEPLDTRIDIAAPPDRQTVLATDGSQIAPSHHEIAYCYLINVGRVMIHYGQNLHPLLDSIPEVFYQQEDLYISRQWGISTEEWLGYRRAVSEATVLAELGCNWVDPPFGFDDKVDPNSPPSQPRVPTLAMVDGSLVYWFLEQLPTDAREQILNPILAAWEELRLAGIPIVGYLSASRSIDNLNLLRLLTCPHDVPDCPLHCGDATKLPCQQFEGLRDTTLWNTQLAPGQRSCWWKSTAKILDYYDEAHKTYFCYLNVGTEIARIEVPAWVAQDEDLADVTLSMIISQVNKGYGYPVALAESHNQAVVRGADRSSFFALLERELIKTGIKNVGTSYKETRKRGSV
uniref:DNA double-strand break repair nuclease NurA n=1 Tax=Chamaesiphon sp. VAR_48_metabat_403 TaxID=2964700 RepID=UPI00286E91FE